MPTTAAQRRRRALEHARDRRRRKAVERKQETLRRATFLGGAIGLIAGVLIGVLLRDTSPAGPSVTAVIGLVAGAFAGAAMMLGREQAEERVRARAKARARERERGRGREQSMRERKARETAAPIRPAEPKPVARRAGADDDFLVPPGFYPDPDGSERQRWWDGAKWTARRAA
jgi:uncharacterized protein DUF2510